jgi:hypothetical protein
MHAEMKAQVQKMRLQQDDIMIKFIEVKKKVEEAGKDAETVYETEMEMIQNLHIRIEAASPRRPRRKTQVQWGLLQPEAAVDKCHYLRIYEQVTQGLTSNYKTETRRLYGFLSKRPRDLR